MGPLAAFINLCVCTRAGATDPCGEDTWPSAFFLQLRKCPFFRKMDLFYLVKLRLPSL